MKNLSRWNFHMQTLDPVFFRSLLFFLQFLALFWHFFLSLFLFLVSFSSFKSLARLSTMHFFNYIFIFWISERQVINVESLINWWINLKYSSQTANLTYLIFRFRYTSGHYTPDNFWIIDINTKVRRIFWSTFVSTFI